MGFESHRNHKLIIVVILKMIRKWNQVKLKSAQSAVRNFPLICLERETVKTVSVLGVKTVLTKPHESIVKEKKISKGDVPNPALAEFTPQDLISELRARGYEGNLTFTEVKVHRIKV